MEETSDLGGRDLESEAWNCRFRSLSLAASLRYYLG